SGSVAKAAEVLRTNNHTPSHSPRTPPPIPAATLAQTPPPPPLLPRPPHAALPPHRCCLSAFISSCASANCASHSNSISSSGTTFGWFGFG
ncbi:MAG: hypothetical protein WCP35_14635, partial [Verrucomicrobiota bacterium]